jgi:tungstate transport system ATP-binding protein
MSLRLVVSNIHKNYAGLPVLKDCSFSFEKNGIHVLMGPNGSGKSTFFRICSLLEAPDNGVVNYYSGNSRVKKDISLMRRISLVLPKIGVFNTTVFKNIAYGLKIRKCSTTETRRKVERALDLVGLIHKKNTNALGLSSGETQRLGIARAIVIEPEILFLDEPTASLDPHSTTVIEETIQQIKEDKKITIIMTTHNVFQAQRLADTVLFMYEGTIVEHGPNKEFFEKPRDERTHRFITGKMVY